MGGDDGEREAALTELRKRLDNRRVAEKLTKTQLVARTNLSRGTVQAAFKPGGPVPSAVTVAALARALRLPDGPLLELQRTAAGEAVASERRPSPGRPIGKWDAHDLEVHPAGTTAAGSGTARSKRPLPGYVQRAHDQDLAEAVQEAADGHSRMLVLVGWSSTGKTRACWEAVQPLAAHGWRLWHPYDPTRAKAALADLSRVAPRTVVWLNEAQHYLGPPEDGELIAAALHTLLTDPDRRPVLVLGTLWPEYADTYRIVPGPGGPDPHSRVRELLAGRTITVPDTFDREALDAATALAQGGDRFMEDTLTRAHTHGRVTQDLAGAPELLRRYEHSTPPAKALLHAAMDARRLGVGLHLPQTFLIEAATDYLTDDDHDQLTQDWKETAFAAFVDLARPVPGKQAPLRSTKARPTRRPPGTPVPVTTPVPGPEPILRLADYLEQHARITRRRLCPPASFWHAAYAYLANPEDLSSLAAAASDRHRLQWAHHLRLRAAEGGHPDSLLRLARQRENAGDREGAEALYRQAASASHPRALNYLVDLARRRQRTGDLEGAEALYRQAADAGHADALIDLARTREQTGDPEGAEALRRRAADAGHPGALAREAWKREQAGDLEGANSLYRRAIAAGGAFILDRMAFERSQAGDFEGAHALYHRAAEAGHPGALIHLASAREEAGDREGAEAFARRADDTYALAHLQWVRKQAGDFEGAKAVYRRAAEAGHPGALIHLALEREGAGDREGAEALRRRAADAGDTDSMVIVARILEEAGDREGADALAFRAAAAGNRNALDYLARARQDTGDLEGAKSLARQASDAGYPTTYASERWPYGLDPDGSATPPWL
ncbi:hypothetical protein [Streptomyces sp. NBC_01565]|uniref:tetratricopeptide repeat protein n=1 Tax=Streptomyces sp. NBC_01565 TaxID=2975881 RepID=UPI002257CB59|nr:hypothetical protein [Streptomyces sp. NBC_01565]MCX4546419.1 hypothetical protein [Streptomyces sp. NBC_01565]